jgi:uncharacterized protein YndB with AHSA1/START domain
MSAKPAAATVTHRFDATPGQVFDAWIDPEAIRYWFAPGMGEMVRIELDRRVGGRFVLTQRRDDKDVEHVGEYLEFDRPNHLSFTWGVTGDSQHGPSRVSVHITARSSGSEVVLTHELAPGWEDYQARVEESWKKMLDAMAGTLR